MSASWKPGLGLGALLAPQQNACHLCGALLCQREAFLCEDCREALLRCRLHAAEALSADCPPLSLVLAAFWYDEEAKTLIHRLKFGHDLAAAQPLADELCAVYARCLSLLPRPDAVVAVPAHASRLRARGYNQAEALARAFCAGTRLPLLADGLTRAHHSTSQVGRGKRERLSAMAGAFQAERSFADMGLLLVDDVFTTGATATACADCLMKAGAKRVDLLVCCKA